MTKTAWLAVIAAFVLSGGSTVYYVKDQASNRRHSVEEKCRVTDTRNARTKAALRAKLKQSHIPQPQQEATKAFTDPLIDTLAPYENCTEALAKAGFH